MVSCFSLTWVPVRILTTVVEDNSANSSIFIVQGVCRLMRRKRITKLEEHILHMLWHAVVFVLTVTHQCTSFSHHHFRSIVHSSLRSLWATEDIKLFVCRQWTMDNDLTDNNGYRAGHRLDIMVVQAWQDGNEIYLWTVIWSPIFALKLTCCCVESRKLAFREERRCGDVPHAAIDIQV